MTDQIKMDTSEMEETFCQECAAEDQERDLVEQQLRKVAAENWLDFWYIGNFESWGDDRKLRFGKDGAVVYECSASSLTMANIKCLKKAIRRMG